MNISITITPDIIPTQIKFSTSTDNIGSIVEFRGIVRKTENQKSIAALKYEAYEPMAQSEIKKIIEDEARSHPCDEILVIHRIGTIPVGETAIYVGIKSKHRTEGFHLLENFMNRLKKDVPIWKTEAIPVND